MTHVALRGLIGLWFVLAAGCVAAYDPTAPSRLGLETRAAEVGTKQERPPAKKQRQLARELRTEPAPQPQPQPEAQPRAPEPPVRPTTLKTPPNPAPQTPPVEIPDTAAGKQLSWWLAVLRGGSTKGLDDHFSPEFLAKVPAAQVREIARQWRRDELADGSLDVIELDAGPSPSGLTTLVRGKSTGRYTRIRLGVDDAGKIQTLWLGPVVGYKRDATDTWTALDTKLAAQPGQTTLAAFEVMAGGDLREIHVFGGDRRLAIASTCKLYILGALAEEVLAGRATWDQPLAIRDDLKSLPSGRMQLETEAAEFPINRYAESMISISDNTAADHLLHRVGREAVQRYMSRLNADAVRSFPFLSTMELFRIKLGPDRTLAPRYAQGDEAVRLAMLGPGGEVSKSTPSFAAASLWKAPYYIDTIEWFATARECCRVMADLHRLELQPGMEPLKRILRLNPGLQFDSRKWPSIAYKGGSEPGVLNMTWMLERDDGRLMLLSFGWNDPAKDVDLKAAADLVGVAMGILAEEGKEP